MVTSSLKTGQARITSAFALPSRFVIHTDGPNC
jgi:O-acetyl-ADP-ribose deacetylase (regulator of RNase III)